MDDMNVGVVRVFIAPTTKLDRWWMLLSMAAPDSPVRHRTVSGAPRKSSLRNSPASGNQSGCSAIIHRTVRCNSGATATSRATVDCNALNARLRAQRSRARAGGTPDSLQGMSGAPPDSQAGPLVRTPTVRTQWPGDVAGAPDSVRWRTGLSGAPCDWSLPTATLWWLGL